MSRSEIDPATGAKTGGPLVPWLALPRFARYLVVGGVNTVFGYGSFAVLLLLGLHYAVAALLATILGILFNFQTIGRLVFERRDHSLIFRFVGVYAATYVLNVGALRLLAGGPLHILAIQALLVLPMAAVSFALHRRFVFGREVASP